jgi:hypothetical protein
MKATTTTARTHTFRLTLAELAEALDIPGPRPAKVLSGTITRISEHTHNDVLHTGVGELEIVIQEQPEDEEMI